MKRKASNMLERMFFSQFPEQQATLPTELSDFTVLMNAGIKVYTTTTNIPMDSGNERLRQFSKLKETLGNRGKDVMTRSQAELHSFQSKTTDPGNRTHPLRNSLWKHFSVTLEQNIKRTLSAMKNRK
ncbi:hypothetical protein FBU30_002133 [Linnemannia zychae]|nr:hypothetical protein FBU30_002133 [Linnemannia zychae]